MAWNKDYPQSSIHKLSDVPEILQGNFSYIEDWFNDDHYTFTSSSSGTHRTGICGVVFYGTNTEIGALTGVASGALAFDTTYGAYRKYTGAAWPLYWAVWSRTRAYVSSGTAITSASTATVVFNTENYDELSEYNNSTGIFTPSLGVSGTYKSGIYLIGAQVTLQASGASGTGNHEAVLSIMQSGISKAESRLTINETAVSGSYISISVSTVLTLITGSTINIIIQKTSLNDGIVPGSQYSYLCIHRIGGSGL